MKKRLPGATRQTVENKNGPAWPDRFFLYGEKEGLREDREDGSTSHLVFSSDFRRVPVCTGTWDWDRLCDGRGRGWF